MIPVHIIVLLFSSQSVIQNIASIESTVQQLFLRNHYIQDKEGTKKTKVKPRDVHGLVGKKGKKSHYSRTT